MNVLGQNVYSLDVDGTSKLRTATRYMFLIRFFTVVCCGCFYLFLGCVLLQQKLKSHKETFNDDDKRFVAVLKIHSDYLLTNLCFTLHIVNLVKK
jgi:hypothetical protein